MSNFANIGTSIEDDVVLLSDVEVPEKFYNRIRTNSQVLDEMFGGTDNPGILPGSVNLFTGMPGLGKSTMCLQLAELFSQQGQSVLYNVGEESKEMIKLRARRLGITGRFPISTIKDVDRLIEYSVANGVEVLFQDSLQSMRSGDIEGNRLLKLVVERLIEMAKAADVTVFLVGQATKGGEFAGPARIKHESDAHAHLSMDLDSGARVFTLQKNRFGPAMVPYQFTMSSQGLDFQAQEIEDGGEAPSENRKDKALDTVLKLLLSGRRLSGYSHEEEPELIDLGMSGGFMRAVLRQAVNKLQREGAAVKTCTLNRREHSYIEIGKAEEDAT